jgi:hypothetical protein
MAGIKENLRYIQVPKNTVTELSFDSLFCTSSISRMCDINKAMLISDAMETGTVQINSAPARGPDHFPFQVNALRFISCYHQFARGCLISSMF